MQFNGSFEIFAQRAQWSNAIHLNIGVRAPSGELDACMPPQLRRIEEGCDFGEPFLRLPTRDAQRLMDELWGCGLRPSEGTGSAGSLAATERHLKDMQEIALGLVQKHLVTKDL